MTLNNLTVILEGLTFGNMAVRCDILFNQEPDVLTHEDNPVTSFVTNITVTKIHSVELAAFDKIGIDLTKNFLRDSQLKAYLENAIVDEVEFKSITELQKQAA